MNKFITVFIALLVSGCATETYKTPTSLNLAKLRFYITPSLAANSLVSVTSYPDEGCQNKMVITDLGESQRPGVVRALNALSGGIDAGVPKNPDSTYQKNNYAEIEIEADKPFYFKMLRDNGKIISYKPKECSISLQFTPQIDKSYQALFNYNEAEERCYLSLSEVVVIDGVFRELKVNVTQTNQNISCGYY
jgi:hypothetical protein